MDIEESVARLHKACGIITKQIRILSEMQISIQRVQAIKYNIGPYALLRERIVKHAARYSLVGEDSSKDGEDSCSVDDDTDSSAILEDNCKSCRQSFNLGSLKLHQELCNPRTAIKTYEALPSQEYPQGKIGKPYYSEKDKGTAQDIGQQHLTLNPDTKGITKGMAPLDAGRQSLTIGQDSREDDLESTYNNDSKSFDPGSVMLSKAGFPLKLLDKNALDLGAMNLDTIRVNMLTKIVDTEEINDPPPRYSPANRDTLDMSSRSAESQIDPIELAHSLGFLNLNQKIKEDREALPETCNWIMDVPSYVDWRDSRQDSVLFIRAGPGWGKSVLSRFIFEHLKGSQDRDDVLVLRFKCKSFGRRSSLKSVLQHVLWHLCMRYPRAMQRVKPDSTMLQGSKTLEYFWDLFISFKNEVKFTLFYVVDGIDECTKDPKGYGDETIDPILLGFLRNLCQQLTGRTESQAGTCKVVLTTRPIIELNKVAEEFTKFEESKNLVFDIKIQNVTLGVEKMIDFDVANFVRDRGLTSDIEDLIKTDLKAKAGPMFQWVWSVVQRLREVPASSNALGAFKAELEKYIPSDIENTYMEAIKSIERSSRLLEDDKHLIASLLRFLVFAEWSVEISDLQYGMASLRLHDTADDFLNQRPQNLNFLLQSFCSNLVIIEEDIVQLAHQSVKTFLLQLPPKNRFTCRDIEAGHRQLSDMCLNILLLWLRLTYISYESQQDVVDLEVSDAVDLFYNISGSVPFSGYAICFWDKHLAKAGRLNEYWARLSVLLRDDFCWLCMMLERERYYLDDTQENKSEDWEHLSVSTFLAKMDLVTVIKGSDLAGPNHNRRRRRIRSLLKHERPVLDPFSYDKKGNTMLHYAAQNGSRILIKLLLRKGSTGHVRNKDGKTPFAMAVGANEEEAAMQLVSANAAHLDIPEKNQISSLQFAAVHDLTKVGKYLLDQRRLSPNEDTGCVGWFPLYIAAQYGSYNIALMLLERNADPQKKVEGDKSTALHAAARKGHHKILELLLRFKEDLEIAPQDSDGWTPLHYAASNGHTESFKFLYERQSTVPCSKFGHFPIHEAVSNGHLSIVKRFTHGESSLENSRFGWTALHIAASNGYIDIVNYLLDVIRVEVNPKAIDRATPETVSPEEALCTTPLILAIMAGNVDVANSLIQHNADIQVKTFYRDTTLLLAIESNLPTLFDELISRGQEIMARNSYNNSVLHRAAALSTPAILQKLLSILKTDSTFNINQQDDAGETALMHACKLGCDDNRQLLLKEGADILIENEVNHSAALMGDFWLLDLYLERGGLVDAKDRTGMTILHQAAAKGELKAIKTLIKCKAEIMAKSIIDETPLLLAVVNMHEKATKELIAAGADINFRDASGRSIIEYITTSSPLSAIFKVDNGIPPQVNGALALNNSPASFVRNVVRNMDSKPVLSDPNSWQDYTELAFLFLVIGRERDSDTRVCLETRLTAVYGGQTRYAASCAGCTRDYMEGAFHICRICYIQVLCDGCYKKFIDGKKDGTPKGCLSEHEYLEFGGTEWKALAPGVVNTAGETLVDFLNRIREEFQDPDSVSQGMEVMPEAAAISQVGGQESEGLVGAR